jgi:hypothetical protein
MSRIVALTSVLGETPLAAEVAEGLGQAVGEVVEHRSS